MKKSSTILEKLSYCRELSRISQKHGLASRTFNDLIVLGSVLKKEGFSSKPYIERAVILTRPFAWINTRKIGRRKRFRKIVERPVFLSRKTALRRSVKILLRTSRKSTGVKSRTNFVGRHLIFIRDIVTKGYSTIMNKNIERYKLARVLRFSRRKPKFYILKKLGKTFSKNRRSTKRKGVKDSNARL